MTLTSDRGLADRRIQEANNIDLSKDRMALQRLKEAAESQDRAVADDGDGDSIFRSSPQEPPARSTCRKSWTRTLLEQLMGDLLDGSMEAGKLALEDAQTFTERHSRSRVGGRFDAYSQGAETGFVIFSAAKSRTRA